MCYAYLADVLPGQDPGKERSSSCKSRWFKRGWTLQELIAPSSVTFLAADWTPIGSKHILADLIEEITGIPDEALLQLTIVAHAKMSLRPGRLLESVGEIQAKPDSVRWSDASPWQVSLGTQTVTFALPATTLTVKLGLDSSALSHYFLRVDIVTETRPVVPAMPLPPAEGGEDSMSDSESQADKEDVPREFLAI